MNVEIDGHMEIFFGGKEITYVINAGIDFKRGMKYFMPSFSFVENYGSTDGENAIDTWDVEGYILKTFLAGVINPWLDHHAIPNTEEFASLIRIKGVSLDDFAGIQELLNRAIDLNLFEDYFNDLENE